MVLLCWSWIAKTTDERFEKADLGEFNNLVVQHCCVWRIEEDRKHLLFKDPDPSHHNLMLLLIDYHTDCSDPAKLAIAEENLEDAHAAFFR